MNYLKENWDILIILDACRYDYFCKVYNQLGGQDFIPGEHKPIDCEAMNSQGWYLQHWQGQFDDVRLLTMNQHPFKIAMKKGPRKGEKISEAFGECINIWAGRAADPVLLLSNLYIHSDPDMRTIIHLMPPHLPYVGHKGKKFLADLESNPSYKGTTYQKVQAYGREGKWGEIIEYYKENLTTALDAVEKHLRLIDTNKQVVVSADHGELIGEYDANKGMEMYHHYPTDIPELQEILKTVPWFEVDMGKVSRGQKHPNRAEIMRRLKGLGYV